jgi:hypothetical protein
MTDFTFTRGTLRQLGFSTGDRVAWRDREGRVLVGVLACSPTWNRLATDQGLYSLGGTATKLWLAPVEDSTDGVENDVVEIRISRRLADDMTPFLEDALGEAQEGKGNQPESVIALWFALEGAVAVNGGRSLHLSLPSVGLIALEDVAVYRAEFHAPVKRNQYGNETPDADTRIAAERVAGICQDLIMGR